MINFKEIPGYILYQFFFWFVVIAMIFGNQENRIIDAFNFTYWPSNIPDIGFIILFVFVFDFINKFILYKNIAEIPSYLPSQFFELQSTLGTYITKGFKNIIISLRNKKIHFKKKIISLRAWAVMGNSLTVSLDPPFKKVENDVDWKRVFKNMPIIGILLLVFYVFTLFYSSEFIEKYDENMSLKDFYENYFLLLWIGLFIVSGILIITSGWSIKKIITLLVSIAVIIQFIIFNLSSLKSDPVYYTILLLYIYVILYPFAYLIVLFIYNIKKIGLSEYNLANQRKYAAENYEIIKDFNKKLNCQTDFSEEEIKILLATHEGSLKNKESLRKFVNKINNKKFSYNDFQRATSTYLLPIMRLKEVRGEEISRRNENNLSIAMSFATILICGYFLLLGLVKLGMSEVYYFNYLDIILVLAFSRFFVRSIEICVSFYNDLHDRPIDKKSSLNSKDRAGLALNSLFEIAILSFITVFCIFYRDNMIREFDIFFIKFFLIEFYNILEVILYTISVSLFNISFTNFGEVTNKDITPLKIIHVIQVISSLVLLTICLSSYINSGFVNKKIIIKKHFDKYYLVEQNIYQKHEKFLIYEGYKQINDLKSKVLKMYHDGDIDSDDFEIYLLTIDSYLLEND